MEFPNDTFKPRKDRYARARGASRFLYIACASCEEPVMVYQKDGPGQLKRCYNDRIVWPPALVLELVDLTSKTIKRAGSLACASCANVIGNPMVYPQEDRPAYRLVPGSMHAYGSVEQAQARAQPEVPTAEAN